MKRILVERSDFMYEDGLKFEEFAYTTQKIRMIEIDSEPWFIVKDVCDILGIKNVADAMKRLDEDEKLRLNLSYEEKHRLNLGFRGKSPWGVNEPGLYTLIACSRKKEAILFRRWVTHEVLPSIRKTGQYIDTDNKFDKFCPVKFDRAGCFEIARKKVHELGLNSKNANLLWRQWYIDFSKEIGFNIDTKAKRENISKIEWLNEHGYMEKFCKFISR